MRVATVLLIALAAGPAAAETTSENVFRESGWEVNLVRFDDGTADCVAETMETAESFSIWRMETGMRLQFYSEAWSFGEGRYGDLSVGVDSLEPWNLTEAELYMNSILFDLPDGEGSGRFFSELAGGTDLFLIDPDGGKRRYSLEGAAGALEALDFCVDEP